MLKLKYIKVFIITCIFAVAIIFFYPNVYNKLDNKEDGVRFLIGVSQPDLMSSWQLALNEEIRDEVAKYPDVRVIFNDAGRDEIKQKRDIENMLEQKINVLIVNTYNDKYLNEVIRDVYASGIPVIVLEDSPAIEEYSTNIYCDNYKIGREAGKYACELLGEKGGTVLQVLGDPDSPISVQRKKGFNEAVKENPSVRLEYVIVGYWSRDKTEERVVEIYRKQPEADIVFAHNDAMAIGAWRVASYEKLSAKFIGIGGIEGKKAGLQAVKNGILDATFIYPTGGREAIDNALRILNGQKVPKLIELTTMRVTKENIENFFDTDLIFPKKP